MIHQGIWALHTLLFTCLVVSNSVISWMTAHQASLTISQNLPKLMSIASVMPISHLILWHPLLLLPSIFASIRDFSNGLAIRIRWSKYWSLVSASVLPVSIQGWFPLRLTDLISLLFKQLSRVFSSTTVQSINSFAFSLLYGPSLTSVDDYWKNQSCD